MFWCEQVVKDKNKKYGIITLNFVTQFMISFRRNDSFNHYTPNKLTKIDSLVISHNKTNVLK